MKDNIKLGILVITTSLFLLQVWMNTTLSIYLLISFIALTILLLIIPIIKIVEWLPQESLIIERRNRFHDTTSPLGGYRLIFPLIGDKVVERFSLRENKVKTQNYTITTEDDVKISIDFSINWQIEDPELLYYKINPEIKEGNKNYSNVINDELLKSGKAIISNKIKNNSLSLKDINQNELETAIYENLLNDVTEYGVLIRKVKVQKIGYGKEYQQIVNQRKAKELEIETLQNKFDPQVVASIQLLKSIKGFNMTDISKLFSQQITSKNNSPTDDNNNNKTKMRIAS